MIVMMVRLCSTREVRTEPGQLCSSLGSAPDDDYDDDTEVPGSIGDHSNLVGLTIYTLWCAKVHILGLASHALRPRRAGHRSPMEEVSRKRTGDEE